MAFVFVSTFTGLSAGTLLLGNGRILGAAGIVRSVLQQSPKTTLFDFSPGNNSTTGTSSDSSNSWKVHFLAAFCLVSDLYYRSSSSSINIDGSGNDNVVGDFVVSTIGYAVAGFLVGLGTTVRVRCALGCVM